MLKNILSVNKRTRVESVSDVSDSDTEMNASHSSHSSRSTPGAMTFEDSRMCDSESYDRGYSNNGSILSSNESTEAHISSHSALYRFPLKQTTPDNRKWNHANGWPQNIDNNHQTFHSRQLLFSGESVNTKLSSAYFCSSQQRKQSPQFESELTELPSTSVLDNDPSVFMHSDTRIPFADYLNNLVRVLNKAAARGELGKSRNLRESNRNLFNFYWDSGSMEKDLESMDRSESLSSKVASDSQTVQPEMLNTESDSIDRRHNDACTPPGSTNNMSADNSPILSGHLAHSATFMTVSPVSQPFLPAHQFSSSPVVPSHPFQAPGPCPILTQAPFLHMQGFRCKDLSADKPPPVKKYKCDVCGKAFSRSNTLVTHKRIHTGAKPFKCEICGRAFRQPGNLTRHRLTHTSVKPYVCPQCNKAFNRASNLSTHMRTHSNYHPFTCTCCGKDFNQKIDLKIHSYSHYAKKPGVH